MKIFLPYLDQGYRFEIAPCRKGPTIVPASYNFVMIKNGINAPFLGLSRELLNDETAFETFLTIKLKDMKVWIDNYIRETERTP